MKSGIFRFLPAFAWLILSFSLLTLPGTSLPKITWFDKLHGDKLVHIFMFGILVTLWLWPFKTALRQNTNISLALLIGGFALAYGIAMEFVQKYFIVNRSFDIGDIIADGVGSFLPAIWQYNRNKKKN